MNTSVRRMASLAILSLAVTVIVTACGDKERLADRRRRAESNADRVSLDGSEPAALAGAGGTESGVAAPTAGGAGTGSRATGNQDDVVVSTFASEGRTNDDDDFDLDFDSEPSRGTASEGRAMTSRGGLGATESAGDDFDAMLSAAAAGGGDGDDPRSAAEVFERMTLDEEAEQATAAFEAKRGDDLFRANQFAEAAQAYRRSLDLDPSNREVRDRYNQALAMTGDRRGEIPAISASVMERVKLERERTAAEIRRNLQDGRAAFDGDELEVAERKLKLALGMIDSQPEVESGVSREEVTNLLREVQNSQADVERKKREADIREAENTVTKELEEEAARDAAKVRDLLQKARRQLRLKDYRKALESTESVLAIEPNNRVAIFWHDVAKDQLERQDQLALILERQKQKRIEARTALAQLTPSEDIDFPVREQWERVRDRQRRAQDISLEEPEHIRAIRSRLESQVIGDINFDETPLSEVIETFRQIAGVNMVLASDVDGESITVTQPISNLAAMSALRLILNSLDLTFTFEDNIMVIGTKENTVASTAFELYNVSDLLTRIRDFQAPVIRLKGANEASGESAISFSEDSVDEAEQLDPESLVELIKATTGGDEEWVEDQGMRIEHNRGQLFVDATPELHQAVRNVLKSLRQDSDLFVIIEARFIDVFDDFLEDIGVDSRGLGLVNNLGVPFGDVINDLTTGGNDIGIVQDGDPEDVTLFQGLDRWAGRVQHIIDGFAGTARGDRLTGGNGLGGGTFQLTWLEPFQVNVIVRMVQEKQDVRQLTAPVVTAHNNERVYVSVITQRAYIADYELVSGGTGFSIIEVADPVVQTFQEGVILDVDPTISHDKKYVTLDVRPTLATLIGGVISTINISLGSFTNVAFQVPIGIPQISLQQSFTSVTVPNGGTVLLGGFKSMDEGRFVSSLPILGQIPILKNLARRKATLSEKRSLVILLTARIVDLRGMEAEEYNDDI